MRAFSPLRNKALEFLQPAWYTI